MPQTEGRSRIFVSFRLNSRGSRGTAYDYWDEWIVDRLNGRTLQDRRNWLADLWLWMNSQPLERIRSTSPLKIQSF